MKEASLPSPGVGSKSMHLRRIMANAISAIEISAPKYTDGIHPSATSFLAFLNACVAVVNDYTKTLAEVVFGTAGDATTVAMGTTLATSLDKDSHDDTAGYTSDDTGIATIHATTGVITPVDLGVATVNAVLEETATFRAVTKSQDIEVVPRITAAGGATTITHPNTLQLTSVDGAYDGTVAWSSSDVTNATVNASGLVTSVSTGPTVITATLPATTAYPKGYAVTYDITVN